MFNKTICKDVLFFAAMASAFLLLSCSKDGMPERKVEENTISVTFEGLMQDDGGDSRTVFYGNGIRWKSGDRIRFWQYAKIGGEWKSAPASKTLDADMDILSATFQFTAPDDGKAFYFSVFPYDRYIKSLTSGSGELRKYYVQMDIPTVQNPVAASFDPTADILLSEYKAVTDDAGSYTLKLRYARPVSIGKMTLTNLPDDETVTGVTFSAAGKKLTGKQTYILNDSIDQYPYGEDTSVDNLSLNYSIAPGTGGSLTAYFICNPFSFTAGESFTVKVTAGGTVYTKTVTLSAAQCEKLYFQRNRGTVFSVNMDTGEFGFKGYIYNDTEFATL